MDCTDIGTIQALLDGELGFERSAELSKHIATCDACATMLADAESESAIVFPVLARELDTLVPTQRLWNKINETIETEKRSLPWWQKAAAFVSVLFASPSLSAVAAILVFAVIGGAFWFSRTTATTDPTPRAAVAAISPASTPPSTPFVTPEVSEPVSPISKPSYASTRTIYRPEPQPRRSSFPAGDAPVIDDSGEENYVSTIATLNKSVGDQKDDALRPAERVAFERDMALVNDTIAKMREQVRKNPKNDSARQILYSSYQNKIDLLNSVAQREELTASLR